MIHIAIMDDDKSQLSSLKREIARFFAERKLECKIQTYLDEGQFERESDKFDVLFFEINLKKTDGLEMARRIRGRSKDLMLVFVTSMVQYAVQGYELDISDFIRKPVKKIELERALQKIVRQWSSRKKKKLILKTAKGVEVISINEVLFVEVLNHALVYHTREGNFQIRGQFCNAVNQFMGEQFQICNRSCLVNLEYVTALGSDYVEIGENRLPVSRARKKELMEEYKNYTGA
ncbi:MAG: LytTR family DNA-binding domain-containing protein [Clostridiales bacterium]|nr:LytTR family DNA-binding domain-containing protein [Clostridiales bacterium]